MSAKSLGAIALALPAASLLGGCGQEPLSSGAGNNTGGGGGPTVANNPENVYTFPFTSYPQLQNAGGSARATINATSGSKDVYITRVSSSLANAVSVVCTHQGCTINSYNSGTQQYSCPCHGAIFAADGTVVQGPATRPLPSYPAAITATSIQVTVT